MALQVLTNGNLLAIDGKLRNECCCTGGGTAECPKTLNCSGGTEPSMCIRVTADDADLPITWCGKTWQKSTNATGPYSGDAQEVCPTNYNSGSSTFGQYWRYNTTSLKLSISISTFDSIYAASIKVKTTGTAIATAFRNFVTPTANFYDPTTWNPLTGMSSVSIGNYLLQPEQFTSVTVDDVTFEWSQGTNW